MLKESNYYTYFILGYSMCNCLVEGKAQLQTWEQNPGGMSSVPTVENISAITYIQSILHWHCRKLRKKGVFSLKISKRWSIGKRYIYFKRWISFHIFPKQGLETMKPPRVILELIREKMKLTCCRAEKPKVISLCWYRGKLKERVFFSSF